MVPQNIYMRSGRVTNITNCKIYMEGAVWIPTFFFKKRVQGILF